MMMRHTRFCTRQPYQHFLNIAVISLLMSCMCLIIELKRNEVNTSLSTFAKTYCEAYYLSAKSTVTLNKFLMIVFPNLSRTTNEAIHFVQIFHRYDYLLLIHSPVLLCRCEFIAQEVLKSVRFIFHVLVRYESMHFRDYAFQQFVVFVH